MTKIVSPTGHRTRAAAIAALAGVTYVVLRYGGLNIASNLLVVMFAMTLAYLEAIFAYFAIMRASAIGARWSLVWIALAVMAVGASIAPEGEASTAVFDVIRLFGGGALIGYLVATRQGLVKAYLAGVVLLILIGTIDFWTIWPERIEVMRMMGEDMIGWLKINPAFTTATDAVQDEMLANFKATFAMTARLTPATMLMSIVNQMSIGFLWFLLVAEKSGRLTRRDFQFSRWKMPWQLSPLLIVAIAMRLLGGETLQLIADNLIMILAVYYCVTGLALVSWFLKLLKLALWFKVLFYIFLTITGLMGFVLISVLGFIDSFRDFRRSELADLKLKKE